MQKILPIGNNLIEFAEIDSTNNYAMQLVNDGMAEHGIIIRADFQTKGKGQLGNMWHAEESKNLLCSIIIDTQAIAIEKQFFVNMATGLAISEMLMETYNIPNVSIKWPNDIYAGNKKIAGILIENSLRGYIWQHAIIGIGLNVNQKNFSDLNRATSMVLLKAENYKVKMVLKQLVQSLNKFYRLLASNEFDLLHEFNNNLYKINNPIVFIKKNDIYKGVLKGVNILGEIEIEVEQKLKKFKHKEIELLLD